MIPGEIDTMSRGGWITICFRNIERLFPSSAGFRSAPGEIVLIHMGLSPENEDSYIGWLSCFLHRAEKSFSQEQLLDMPMMCEDRFSKVLDAGRRLYGKHLNKVYGLKTGSEDYRETVEERFPHGLVN
tara:strand:+ start:41 stop:424 length:384 start_codon:yes stop_codon:yes gene_type:complete